MLRHSTLAVALIMISSTCFAADATIGDVINQQVAEKRRSELPSTLFAKEDSQIPTVASLSGIGNALTVKFLTSDGAVSVSDPNSAINSHWMFLRRDEGLSVLIQNSTNKKVYRITMKIPDDLEFGQKEKESSTTAVEMTVPPFPTR